MKRARDYQRPRYSKRSRRPTPQRSMRSVIGRLAESKRENFHVTSQTLNHDAGSGQVVGGFARPNNRSGFNWMGLNQGDSKHDRDGDSIFSQYIDYKLQLTGYSDYPSQSCRVIIFTPKALRTNTLIASSNVASLFVTDGSDSGSGNLLIQPVDTFNYNVLRDFVVHPLKNQNQNSSAAQSTGLLYDVLHPSISSGPFTSVAGTYRELFNKYHSIIYNELPALESAAPTLAPYIAAKIAESQYYINEYVDDVTEYSNIPFDPVDDAGNDCNYPIVSGRIKTNRRVQYETDSVRPLKTTDFIQIAIIPYADPSAVTTTTIMRYNQEVTHYFKDF
nr:putative capsid protein [Avon-Heathcote Estuary associated circular virus 27]